MHAWLLHDYQRARLRSWLNPDAQPHGAGWRLLELRRLLGEGGWWGANAPWPAGHSVSAFEAPYIYVGHQAGWLAMAGVVLLNAVVGGLPEIANTPPLLGYGGSAVVAALLSLGLLVHVLRRAGG